MSISRRKLLRDSSQTIAGACALGSVPVKASPPAPAVGVDYYRKLGVTPFINAAGTYTILSASLLPAEVQAAIAVSAQKPVHLMPAAQGRRRVLGQALAL